MEFRLLGPVAVVDGGREVIVRQRRQRALLALLLLHLGETVSVDRLLEELWGSDGPRTALASLHNAVSQLRRLVGPDALVTRAPGYALTVEPASLDTVRFEQLLAEAQAARSIQDHATTAIALREALALWHGRALADLAYEPFAQAEIRRLEELRQTALEDRIEADLAQGRHEEVVAELERLVADEPLRERLHGQLLLALYRAGRQADALAAYRAARQTLVDELGIEPGPDLKQLEQAILRQDESLLLPGSAPIATAAPMQFRRLATILFADVAAVSTDDEELDPEAVHRLLTRYDEAARAVVARHGGWIDKAAGDALMAAFGAQAADETHVLRAARAALELRAAVTSLNEETQGMHLELREGLAAGEVLVSSAEARQQFVSGEAVRLSAGLAHAASAGEIVVGPLAGRLLGPATLEPLGELALRGRTKPVAAVRLLSLADGEGAGEQHLDAPFVGRKRELKTLRAALRQARAANEPRALCLLGPAGIGKSRLGRELARGARGFDVLTTACLSYGEGVTYLPVRALVGRDQEAIRAVLGDGGEASAAARRLARLDGPAPEIAWAFRLWCEARARRKPLLLIVDDLHWAEPTFLDLLEHLAERGTGPIVLLGLAREELLEERPSFLESTKGSERIALEGLATAETGALVDHLLAGGTLSADALARVFETAEGNPLYVEQLVALAAEGDPLAADRRLPETVQALLAARLDRLGPGERAVLERAAVIGRDFTTAELTTLLDPEAVPTTARHLTSLDRRGFVRATGSGTWRIRHVLVQEATYRAAPKVLRANLHERFADALDRGGDAPDVMVGTHLERAYRLRAELGPADRAALRLAEDAGRRLGAAGIRAWQRFDAPAAINLLQRATSLLPSDDTGRLELLCELGTVFKFISDDVAAEAALTEASGAAEASGEARLHMRAELERAWPRYLRGDIRGDEIVELAQQAIPAFEAVGDERSMGRAWQLIAAVHSLRGQWLACKDAAGRALACHERTGFPGGASVSLLAASVYAGPEPVNEAIEFCERLLEPASRDAVPLLLLAHLEAMRGRFEVAREALGRSRAFVEERGGAPSGDWFGASASVEMLADRPQDAETILRDACARLEARGDRAWLATLEAALAEALYTQGRVEEAAEHARRAEGLSPPDDLTAQTAWRRVLAKASSADGDVANGELLAREAVGALAATDAVNDQAVALLDLAEVLYRAAKTDEAREKAEAGLDILARKGNSAEHARARRRLVALDPEGTWDEGARAGSLVPSSAREAEGPAGALRV